MPPLTPSESNATQGDAPDAPASTLGLPEEALRASETPSRTSASADVIYRMSPDWREMRQIDSRDFLANTAEPSENWLETYIAPEDQPQVSAVIAEAVRTGTPFELEHRVRQADGSLGWTSSRAVPVRDERGAVVEWIGAAIDITAHKAAEARLRESEERYRTLFAAMDQGLCVIEKVATPPGAPSDFRYLEANPAFLRHTGLPDPVGKTILELVPNAEPEILAAYDRVVATGKPERVEALVADIDMWMEADVYPTPEPGQIAVLFTNITERKRAEAALRASEARQAFLLQVTDAVGQQADPVKIRATATQLLAEYLDTDRAMYAEIVGETGKEESFIRGQFVRRGTPFPDRVPYAAFTEGFTHEALSSGEAVIVSDTATDPRLLASVRDAWLAADVGALIAVPLIRQGRVAIILGVQCATPRFWTQDEIELMHEVAERTWTAVEWGRAEAALRESEQRARLIVEQATDYAIFTTDSERRIDTWSPGAAAVYGWSPEEAIGQLMDMTYTPEDRTAGVPEHELATTMAKGYTPNVRWHQRRDGTLVFIEGVAYARWAEDSAFQGVFTIGQDITARLEAEAARLDEEAARREKEVSMREELAEQVHAATTELRNLSRRLLLVQEEERRRLALELHDEIGQVLTGLTFQIAAAQGNGGEATLDDVNVTVRGLTEQVRQLALNLRPQVLDRYGLLVAVQWHVERFQAATGITVHLQEHEVAQERYPPEVEIAAFRVVQEALTNIARYAEVQEARVTLISDNNLLLVINDHGRGFDPDEDRESSGVGGMRERVSLLGGSFVLETAPGQGVHITAEFPLDAGMQRNATEETAS